LCYPEEENRRNFTIEGDSSVTRIGEILRKTKLDELPQLINILRGEMGVVGPRPLVTDTVYKYIKDYKNILIIRPGLTDFGSLKYLEEGSLLSQQCTPGEEYYNEIMPDKVELAKYYVSNFSFKMDLGLITKTIISLASIIFRELWRFRLKLRASS
jgi:lipopolysaccharide/colanic/teichoic acid biosynthesis glycosyltransferase